MSQSTERIQRFRAEVAEMRVPDPVAGRDRLYLWLGGLGMIVGVGVTVLAYFMSHGTENPLQQRDAIVQALIGLSVVVLGAALFVRGSLTGFLRFWMARLCYEQQAQADRIAEAINPARPVNPGNSLHQGAGPGPRLPSR
jgi:hypothetical protein